MTSQRAKNNPFVLYNKNSNGLLKNFEEHEKSKNKSADVDLTSSLRVSFNKSRSANNNQRSQ